MPINHRSVGDGVIKPYHLSDGFKKGKYFYEVFGACHPQNTTNTSSLTALASAAVTQVSQIRTPAGNFIEMYQTTEQTIHPVGHASGLVLDGDQVDNESAEFVPGGNSAVNPLGRTIGTDKSFAIRALIGITDASGSDQLLVGFRKQEAYAVPTSFLTTGDGTYTDFAGIGFAATKADPNPVNIAYDLNNSGSTTVQAASFTWADGKFHLLEMRVIGRRASWFINGYPLGSRIVYDGLGAALTAQNTVSGPAFDFDSGDFVIPFIFVRQDADVTGGVFLKSLEIGDLDDMMRER